MHQSKLYFHQNCPVCGRGIRVPIALLGKEIACRHCTAISVACDDGNHPSDGSGISKIAEQSPFRQVAFGCR